MNGGTELLPRVGFVMEQHVGLRTYSENIRQVLAATDGTADIEWLGIDYAVTECWWERLPVPSVREAMRGRKEVRTGLGGREFDVCVFNTQVPAVLGGRRARSAPYVLCTDVTPVQYDAMGDQYSHRADGNGPIARVKHSWNRHVFRGAAAHAPWSNWVRHSLIADYGVDPQRIEVIPPGVDTSEWHPGDRSDNGPMRILFVGGDFRRKGGDLLLDAFSALPLGTAELVLVTREAIERRPGVRAYHHLTPNDPELIELFRSSDVFVLPSRSETFGISAIEAAASGLAVVATPVGGLGDLVIDGVTGILTTPGSVEDLTRHLLELADDPALHRRMGEAARDRAVLEFDATVNARRLLQVALRCVRD